MGQAKAGPYPTAMGACPICKEPTVHETRPFCSKRCADLDLMRWLKGSYVIEGASQDDDEDGDGADAPPEATGAPPRRDRDDA